MVTTLVEKAQQQYEELVRFEAIIHSMTLRERRRLEIIEASRRRRIARGSSTDPQDVSGLIKSFAQVRDMMKAMSGMSVMNRGQNVTCILSYRHYGMVDYDRMTRSAQHNQSDPSLPVYRGLPRFFRTFINYIILKYAVIQPARRASDSLKSTGVDGNRPIIEKVFAPFAERIVSFA